MRWNEIAKANALFLICVAGLLAAGLATLWWIPPPKGGTEHHYFFKQLTWLAIGLGAAVLLLIPHYLRFRSLAYPVFAVTLLALAAVRVLASPVKGSHRWFSPMGFSIQPSEFAKIGTVLALACYMMYRDNIRTWTGLVGPFLLAACPLTLVLIQPDLGTALLFFPTLLAMVFAAGARRRHLGMTLGAAMLFLPIAFQFFLKPYQRIRLVSWAVPSLATIDDRFQQLRAIAAVAAGGFFGAGWGEGMQSYALSVPEHQTDFIFAAIAEEWGLLGTTALLSLYGVYVMGGLWLAYRTREPFGRLLVVGLLTMQGAQAAINIGMNIGIAPITGVTLPFVSYGGSSLLASFIGLALILNVNARWVPSFGTREFTGDEPQIPDVGVRRWAPPKSEGEPGASVQPSP